MPVTVPRGGSSKSAAAKTANRNSMADRAGGSTPGADLMGELMFALSGGWDTPGTPGYMVSQAGRRSSLRSAAAQAEAQRAAVYDQILSAVTARNPQIREGYQNASKQMQDNAVARALADRAALTQRNDDAVRASAAYGFSAPVSATDRTAQTVEGNIGQYQSIADAWKGFNSAAAETAVQRNDAIADSFRYLGTQQAAALQQQLLAALAGAQDYYVGGSPGSRLSNAQKVSLLKAGLSYDIDNTQNSIASTKLLPRVTVKNPSGSVSYYQS